MKSLLIITEFDIGHDARPRRLLNLFRNKLRVTILSRGKGDIPGIEYLSFAGNRTPSFFVTLRNRLARLISTNPFLLTNQHDVASFLQLQGRSFDIVFCFDIRLLPLVEKYLKYQRLIVDLREAYPLHFNERWLWRLINKRIYWRICEDYLESADHLFSISNALRRFYKENFGVETKLIYSLPPYHEIKPEEVDPSSIKLVYHGAANSNRGLEVLIETVGEFGKPYSLHLHLMCTESRYMEKLVKLASHYSNVFIENLIPFESLVSHTSRYDIGVFLAKPVNYNLEHCMPNKLFQYIQSRLMILTGPLPDMGDFVTTHQVGEVLSGFSKEHLNDLLSKLTPEEITRFKRNSDASAKRFHEDADNQLLISGVID